MSHKSNCALLGTVDVLPMVVFVLFISHTRLEAKDTPARQWFERATVGMEVGPTGAQFGYSDRSDKRYCSKWDGCQIVKKCVEANAEYLVLWLRDGDYAYYNSKLLSKAPGLGDRDPLRDAMDEAKKHGLPMISYCVVQQGGIFLSEHPEWAMRGVDGGTCHRFCYNSGYLEAMKKVVAEQLSVRHRRLSYRHAGSGVWQSVRMLVRHLPQALRRSLRPRHAKWSNVGQRLGRHASVSL